MKQINFKFKSFKFKKNLYALLLPHKLYDIIFTASPLPLHIGKYTYVGNVCVCMCACIGHRRN